jgi:hypothetical protein
MSVLIGADPEVLLVNGSREFRSVEGLIGGTKDEPVPITSMEQHFKRGFAMQEDNVMLEFNIEPQKSAGNFDNVISSVMSTIRRNVLAEHRLSYWEQCVGEYNDVELATGQAATFGCSPDLDAYTGQKAEGVSPSMLGNWRCAGGHMHWGFDNPADIPLFVIVQLLDAVCGLREPLLKHSQGVRRKMYGTAGRYRAKPYGLEYRTLSNSWLFDEQLRYDLADKGRCIIDHVDKGNIEYIQHLYSEIPRGEVQRAINTEDFESSRDLNRYINSIVTPHHEEESCDEF